MAPPVVLVKSSRTPFNYYSVDVITMVYIACELPFGIIRLPVLCNVRKVFVYVSVVYALVLLCFISVTAYNVLNNKFNQIMVLVILFQYIFSVFYTLIYHKHLQLYYKELDVFDVQCCKSKIAKDSVYNLMLMFLSCAYFMALSSAPFLLKNWNSSPLVLIPAIIIHVMEQYYIGHLLTLLTPRLRRINHYVGLPLNNKNSKGKKVERLKIVCDESLLDMRKLMSLYDIIIKANSCLYDAIKWQLLVSLVNSYTATLCFCYKVVGDVLHGKGSIYWTISLVSQVIIMVLPMFAPCAQAGKVQGEVRRLRELLAYRLYHNALDKASRGAARALLARAQRCGLSLSLLRVVDVDVSLPLKYVGLLATHLMILLQFEKLINL